MPRPSADSAVCVQAQNRRCSKINLCICTPVYKFNIDELLLKLLAKGGSLTYFMSEADLGFFRSRGHNGATIYREGPSLPFKSNGLNISMCVRMNSLRITYIIKYNTIFEEKMGFPDNLELVFTLC